MVTRGNVAIYCYNALTAKMWDVYESTNGELTSSKVSDTILSKFFSDFVNEEGKMKLVEEATVVLSGATTGKIGASQIVVDADGLVNAEGKSVTLATFIDAENKPKRDAEEATYAVKDITGLTNGSVIAYVPAEVANIASLANKKVDVIFGKDNVVAYLVVTDDSTEAAYVTAWDTDEDEITIDGTLYELYNNVAVTVFNQSIGKGAAAIDALMSDLGIDNPAKYITRNIIAETTLNADDEIATINFKFSVDSYTNGDLTVSESIVEKVSTKNVLTVEGNFTEKNLEKLEETDEPRVIRNGEVATLYDIEVGDVLTEVKVDGKVVTVIATAETAEGIISNYTAKSNVYTIDGEKLVVSLDADGKVEYNKDGDLDSYKSETPAKALKDYFEDEEVTVYLNMAGEVVAVVAETNATGTTLGVVTGDYEADGVKEIYEDSNDVEYAKIKILAADGSNKTYKIYNDNKKSSVAVDTDYTPFAEGQVVSFQANADREIKASDIEEVKNTADPDGKEYTFGTTDKITAVKGKLTTIDDKNELIEGNKFTASTVVINKAKEEIVSDFDAVVDGSTFKDSGDVWMFTRGKKIIYIVASIADYAVSTDKYGILLDTSLNDDEDGADYLATILVDGVEEVYESSEDLIEYFELGDFISFNVSDNEIEFVADKADAVKNAKAAVATKEAAVVTAEAAVATAEAELATAKAALAADPDDSDLQAAVTTKETAVTTAKAGLTTAETELATAKTALATAIYDNVTPTLLIGADFIDDLDDLDDEDLLKSAYINEVHFAGINGNSVYGSKVDFIKVAEDGFDGDSIVFENASATTAFLATDCIIYNLADRVEVDTIEDESYVLLADYDDTDKEYGIVIIVK